MRCRGLPRVANPAFLGEFLCSDLLRVAPYCAPGDIRVVSISRSYPCNTGTPSRPRRDARLEAQSRLSGRKPPGRVRRPGGIEPGLCRVPSRLASISRKGSKRVFTSIRCCNLRDSESSRTCYHPYGWRGAYKLSETEDHDQSRFGG